MGDRRGHGTWERQRWRRKVTSFDDFPSLALEAWYFFYIFYGYDCREACRIIPDAMILTTIMDHTDLYRPSGCGVERILCPLESYHLDLWQEANDVENSEKF